MTAPDYTLYLVTDAPQRYSRDLLTGVEEAVAGGASVVQYRATSGTKGELYNTARALSALLRPRKIPLIINDHVDLALAVGADGVHVGQNDLPPAVVRRLLGPERLLGLSITEPRQLDALDPTGIDYLGIGPVFATASKADAAQALGVDTLATMVKRSPLPVVAIGGISVQRAPDVFATGVAGIAVVAALSTAPDPTAAALALRAAAARRPAA